ncbi:hypothetical protein Nepgr_017887 [Nepenthes gracilis]|uniref:Myb/SANT-like DNA-binding domain-containing protein n=1 Tax=Nepenthes gracilis TaxID=150966 RepID=A0AAD3SST8_NEPGR|nr:hypothetical protein Nepgr_017887 [Nepenthes gracilis]
MEDDEETQSHPLPGSESPSSPQHNGRITVTVAVAPPPPPMNSLALALPIQQPRTSGGFGGGGSGGVISGGGNGGREDSWSESATSVLIDAWGERYLKLSRGNLKQQHWKEVADIVNGQEDYPRAPKTDIQCKNRIDTVKKKYKIEKAKIASGGGPSKWPFFNRMERLLGPTAKIPAQPPSPPGFNVQKVPFGIPIGVRSVHHFQQPQQNKKEYLSQGQTQNQPIKSSQNNIKKQQLRKRSPVDSESESDGPAPDSIDSFPPDTNERMKRPRTEFNSSRSGGRAGRGCNGRVGWKRREGVGWEKKEGVKGWEDSVMELTMAILKFGEAYERTETTKLQQLVEMEKQRMKFAKELELQRMKFLMSTRLELSKLSKNMKVGDNDHHSNNHPNISHSNNLI